MDAILHARITPNKPTVKCIQMKIRFINSVSLLIMLDVVSVFDVNVLRSVTAQRFFRACVCVWLG